MKKSILILLMGLGFFAASAQVVFETRVSAMPAIADQSFQVQYVLEDAGNDDEFTQPDFKGLRIVSGPDTHKGSAYGPGGLKKLKNIVFTLVAPQPGRYIIAGAEAKINGQSLKGKPVYLRVISQAEATKAQSAISPVNDEYFLRPGEDPYEKINRNLYMKVEVDKKACYVGESVVATFKLYSRLDSKSDIVKNPGFYGFTVQDMINLDDKLVTQQMIDGKKFDVHTVRKVQLYPLQAGSFMIDAMEVMNKTRFSKSAVSKKTEQEITEGVYPEEDRPKPYNTEEYENTMHTEPLFITVKPVPVAGQPGDFNGATGRFSIHAALTDDKLTKNEEGELIITINGRGNFTQMAAPSIQWPAGIEGFDPLVKDSLDKTHSPMKGSRSFRYRFVSAKAGSYLLPAVHFSFFDPDSNGYKTITTADTNLVIENKEREIENKTETNADSTTSLPVNPAMVWLFIIVFLVLTAAWWTWRQENRRTKLKEAQTVIAKPVELVSVETILQPAYILQGADDKTFYTALRGSIWNFMTERFSLTGSLMNKYHLSVILEEKKIEPALRIGILDILSVCEEGIFTSADTGGDKQDLLLRTRELLEKIG